MYKIGEFSKMVGLPQSKVRFYEKNGLLKPKRDKNGYQYFSSNDAFRVNAFRVLLHYGFTVEKSIEMLDEKQSGDLFVNSLIEQKEEMEKEIEIKSYRLKKLNQVILLLKQNNENSFDIIENQEFLYVYASKGTDFSISVRNAEVIAKFAELLCITSYARIINKDDLLQKGEDIYPSYTCLIPASKEHFLGDYDKSKVNHIKLGKCIRYSRNKTREESIKWESFHELLLFIEENNYQIRDDIIILPTFLNLDGKGMDVEILYVPIY